MFGSSDINFEKNNEIEEIKKALKTFNKALNNLVRVNVSTVKVFNKVMIEMLEKYQKTI